MAQSRFQEILQDVDAACRQLADPKLAAKYERYFSEGYDAYGVRHDAPAWEERKRAWFAKYQDLGLSGFLELGKALFATGKYEHGALAVWFLIQFRDRIGPRAFAGIGKWFDGGVRNWAHSDVICGELLSRRLESGDVGLEALTGWRKSPHKFKRRAAPVAMLGLLKKPENVRPLLEFLRPLMMDPEKVVQQGLGWFLREAWKRQPKPVESFLAEWKDTAPRLIFQYATEKMSAAERQRFRRGEPMS
jgi:3-methyladenine DNA glycosylase AlkD